MSLSVSDFAESEVESLDESVEVDEESSLVLFLVSALLDESDLDAVSYTHLTLPTNSRV